MLFVEEESMFNRLVVLSERVRLSDRSKVIESFNLSYS